MKFPFLLDTLKSFLKHFFENLNLVPKHCITHYLQKGCFGFFNFFLDLKLFAKIEKDLVSTNSQKPSLSITQDLNKMKKTPNTILYTLVSRKRVQSFSKKY